MEQRIERTDTQKGMNVTRLCELERMLESYNCAGKNRVVWTPSCLWVLDNKSKSKQQLVKVDQKARKVSEVVEVCFWDEVVGNEYGLLATRSVCRWRPRLVEPSTTPALVLWQESNRRSKAPIHGNPALAVLGPDSKITVFRKNKLFQVSPQSEHKSCYTKRYHDYLDDEPSSDVCFNRGADSDVIQLIAPSNHHSCWVLCSNGDVVRLECHHVLSVVPEREIHEAKHGDKNCCWKESHRMNLEAISILADSNHLWVLSQEDILTHYALGESVTIQCQTSLQIRSSLPEATMFKLASDGNLQESVILIGERPERHPTLWKVTVTFES